MRKRPFPRLVTSKGERLDERSDSEIQRAKPNLARSAFALLLFAVLGFAVVKLTVPQLTSEELHLMAVDQARHH